MEFNLSQAAKVLACIKETARFECRVIPTISLRVATFRGFPQTIQSNAKRVPHAIIPSNPSQFVFQHMS
jgi:hypothetical protein